MKGIFAVTKHGHVLALVKEGITDSAVADPVTFHLGHSRQRVLFASSAGSHDANLTMIRCRKPLGHKLRTVEHQVHHFVIYNLRAKIQSLFLAHLQKFFAGQRFF